ncbi:MAG: prepilin-type N-terminal cleavage/methylation domain-containing protein [Candidatus Paceibacterota bacterium]
MQNKIKNKGFTLIELLVVIAIIGILAGIIVVSMGTAQKQGEDAKMQTTMDQMRTAAQMYYLTNSNYGTAGVSTISNCAIAASMTATNAQDYFKLCDSLTTKPVTTITGSGATSAYCAYAQKKADTSKYWCIDSLGNSVEVTAITLCTGSTSYCQ